MIVGLRPKIWDAVSGQEVLTLRHTYWVNSVAFSPDGKRLATASYNHMAKIWDADSGQEVLTLRGHSNNVNSVAFSPDGKRLATASNDNTAKIWDAASGHEVLTLRGHTKFVFSVAFSPDGKRLATANQDDTVEIWDATFPANVGGETAAEQAKMSRNNQAEQPSGASTAPVTAVPAKPIVPAKPKAPVLGPVPGDTGDPVVKPTQVAEKYVYDGGSFTIRSREGKSEWVESKADGSPGFRFAETGRDKDRIRLFDSSRNMVLRLPVRGGICDWSTDDGKTWNAWLPVNKVQ
jgi:WD40 repeat protein